jgi:tRNA threonylcarbamoyladenosine biosynthesis protein TsaE
MKSPAETRTWKAASVDAMLAVGTELGTLLEPGDVVLLQGEMGAGKTTLAKGIVAGYGAGTSDDVHSPTFPIVHEYRGTDPARLVYHLDLYRLGSQQEVLATGLDDLLDSVADGEALMLVEWGERYPALWPRDTIRIAIQSDDDLRTVRLSVPELATENGSEDPD